MPTTEPTEPDAPASPGPDWSSTPERIACPLCDYDLRGLTHPRCPECGYQFHWLDLTDPARRKHPFVFEHHPEANVWSFFKTLFAGLRPRAFWTSLLPSQPSKPKRLAIYALIVTSFAGLMPLGLITGEAVRLTLDFREVRRAATGIPRPILDINCPLPPSLPFFRRLFARRSTGGELLPHLVATMGWPWFTFAGLMVFQISMLRAKVDNVHVLRCVVYCADVVILPSIVLAFAFALFEFDRYTTVRGFYEDAQGGLALVLAVLSVILFTHRLWRAFKNYLQFDHPFATVFCSQVIAFFMTLLVLNLNSATHGWIQIGY